MTEQEAEDTLLGVSSEEQWMKHLLNTLDVLLAAIRERRITNYDHQVSDNEGWISFRFNLQWERWKL